MSMTNSDVLTHIPRFGAVQPAKARSGSRFLIAGSRSYLETEPSIFRCAKTYSGFYENDPSFGCWARKKLSVRCQIWLCRHHVDYLNLEEMLQLGFYYIKIPTPTSYSLAWVDLGKYNNLPVNQIPLTWRSAP